MNQIYSFRAYTILPKYIRRISKSHELHTFFRFEFNSLPLSRGYGNYLRPIRIAFNSLVRGDNFVRIFRTLVFIIYFDFMFSKFIIWRSLIRIFLQTWKFVFCCFTWLSFNIFMKTKYIFFYLLIWFFCFFFCASANQDVFL